VAQLLDHRYADLQVDPIVHGVRAPVYGECRDKPDGRADLLDHLAALGRESAAFASRRVLARCGAVWLLLRTRDWPLCEQPVTRTHLRPLRDRVFAHILIRNSSPLSVLRRRSQNWSLTLLSVSYHTIIKSSTPAVVLVLGLALGLERFRWLTCFAVLSVIAGQLVASLENVTPEYSDKEKMHLGIILCCAAVLASGCKWVSMQILLSGSGASGGAFGQQKHAYGPLASLLYTQPLVGAFEVSSHQVTLCRAAPRLAPRTSHLAPRTSQILAVALQDKMGSALPRVPCVSQAILAVSIEGSTVIGLSLPQNEIASIAMMVLAVAGLLSIMLIAEYTVVRLTSSLTMTVLGSIKEIGLFVFSTVVFGEVLTGANMAGFIMCTVGLLLYAWSKAKETEAAPLETDAIPTKEDVEMRFPCGTDREEGSWNSLWHKAFGSRTLALTHKATD
jgi:drug/metabolite transporter (DMT)-like permease